MNKIHLGAGANSLEGWQNFDREIDITRTLPFQSGTVDRIFCEHTIEHITQEQGIGFLDECCRVLVPGGRLRLSFPTPPDPLVFSAHYRRLAVDEGFGALYPRAGLRDSKAPHSDNARQLDRACLQMMFWHWGHCSIWSVPIAAAVCFAVGFDGAKGEHYGESEDPELRGIDCRHLHIGRDIAIEETGIVEAWR